MTTIKRFAFSLFLTCCALALSASAQTPQVSTVNVTPEPQAAEGPTPQAVGTITGEGANNRIAKFTGANTIANSIITELASKIGIGTASPGFKLTVTGGGTTVISATNNTAADPAGKGITGTGGPGAADFIGIMGGAGVFGKGGKGGFGQGPHGGGLGGDGVLGIGGEGGESATGQGSGGTGVHGIGGSAGATGVFGESLSGHAVIGDSDFGFGVLGRTESGYAVYGNSTGVGHAGYFSGRVEITGNALINGPSLSFSATSRQMINLYNTAYGIGVQSGTQYYRTASGFAWFKGGAHSNSTNNPGSGGTLLMRVDSNGNLFTTGAVNPPSDRNMKADFSSVNPQLILRRLASMPIQTWSYKADGDAVRHLGPVAQDFKAAFDLGADDKTIATVDADGVALAAIQGLYQQNQELARTVKQQGNQIEQLLARLRRQEAHLDQVRRTVKRGRAAGR